MKRAIIISTLCGGFLSGTAQAQSIDLSGQADINFNNQISGFTAPISAANSTTETTVQIGVPGQRPQDSIQGLTISTAQIDNFIRRGRNTILEEVPEFQFVLNRLSNEYGVSVGNNVSRTLANEAFDDIESMRLELNQALRKSLLALSEIRTVSELDVNLNPLRVTIVQSGTNLRAELSNLTARVSGTGKVGGIFCGRVSFTGNLSQGKVSLTYNARTGQIIDRDSSLTLSSFNANCSSPIGDFLDIFVNERKLLEGILRNVVADEINTYDFGELFSIDDTLESLDAFCVNVPEAINVGLPSLPVGNTIPSDVTISGVRNLCRSKAGATVDIAKEVLNGGFQGSGLQIDFLFSRSTNSNFIQLTASHNPPTQRINSQTSGWVQMEVTDGANTRNTETYVRHPHSWNNIKDFDIPIPNSNEIFAGQFPNDTAIVSIGESRLLSGLYSFPSEQIRTEVQSGCLNIICEDPNSPGGFGF